MRKIILIICGIAVMYIASYCAVFAIEKSDTYDYFVGKELNTPLGNGNYVIESNWRPYCAQIREWLKIRLMQSDYGGYAFDNILYPAYYPLHKLHLFCHSKGDYVRRQFFGANGAPGVMENVRVK